MPDGPARHLRRPPKSVAAKGDGLPRVGFHGVRGSCPCSDPALARYGGATASVTVDAEDGTPPVLLDLGTGCRQLGRELLRRYFPGAAPPAGAPPHDEHALFGQPHHKPPKLHLSAFVTHLHFDHVQGLPFFEPALRPDVRLDIYGPAQDTTLAEAFARFVQPPYFPVGVEELPAEVGFYELGDGGQVIAGSCSVLAREVPHVGRTLGYRVSVGDAVVAYLGDHQAPAHDGEVSSEVAEGVVELCAGADLLIHDAQYTPQEFKVKSHWGHSTIAYALRVAQVAGVAKLALFHHDPTHDDDTLDRLAAEAAEAAGEGLQVVMASEGLELQVETGAAASAAGAGGRRLSPSGRKAR
jgi:phosphoribosyl 1,2-cyclic phosphodiesterase